MSSAKLKQTIDLEQSSINSMNEIPDLPGVCSVTFFEEDAHKILNLLEVVRHGPKEHTNLADKAYLHETWCNDVQAKTEGLQFCVARDSAT